jgi:hypothetical protein
VTASLTGAGALLAPLGRALVALSGAAGGSVSSRSVIAKPNTVNSPRPTPISSGRKLRFGGSQSRPVVAPSPVACLPLTAIGIGAAAAASADEVASRCV